MGVFDIKGKVRAGLQDYLESDDSKSFKEMGGSDEIVKLAMKNDNFLQAVIDGSKKLAGGFVPSKEGIESFIDALDDIAERHGNSYEPLLAAYDKDPANVIALLKNNDMVGIEAAFKENMNGAVVLSNGGNEPLVNSIEGSKDMELVSAETGKPLNTNASISTPQVAAAPIQQM